ncbi:MAG: bifunctional phosphopantothenoylcysteine decarboxylase/phosphopantothenate--cysteine ligase CoaBC [Thermoanaerobacteraceae bacterium]|nr:bifunctional phosphopantothenoylcysteine decarboxylase/phosphopantothenate--cysteine ligase CoaBC [Thermoanaerobacteraceae bacterium]
MLKDKTIIVGVSGGIAAYKVADLVSRLRKQEARIHVIMTEAAKQFITPITMSTLSGNPVLDDMFSNQGIVNHIDLALKADAMVVAPATANIIGKMAHGIADDFLSTTVLAMRCPIILAPAMNDRMYLNSVVQENLALLQRRGFVIVQPESGALACGTEGPGRLAPVEQILKVLWTSLQRQQDLKGKKVLVTAGGTREPLDPVRFLGNRSSGKMGFAVAKVAAERGAEVVLVHANTHLPLPPQVRAVPVTTAEEMYHAVIKEFSDCDVVVKAAAVADFRPKMHAEKLKKQGNQLTITLEPTVDILAQLGRKKKKQVLVGFAAETNDLLANARDKIEKKNLDLIVANDVSRPDIGFASDDNQVTFLYPDGRHEPLGKMTKEAVAQEILDRVVHILNNKLSTENEE